MPLTQKTRSLNLTSPLGEDVLLLTRFTGQESMSRLFSYQLDMISENNAVTAADIVGSNVTFSVKLQDDSRRYFNGFVSRLVAGREDLDGVRVYRAEVVPWLWFLTRTADCRIFQNKTVPQIIETIFSDLGFSGFEPNLRGNHKKWEYCVQYRETDFNFVSRLMEQEGIFYYFKHEDGKHTMVLADNKDAYATLPDDTIDYPQVTGPAAFKDHITDWTHHYEFRSGKYAQTDYDFEKPSTSLMTNTKSIVSLPGIDKFEIYDFPGIYSEKSDGEAETKVHMEEVEAAFDQVQGASLCRTFGVGCKFTIGEHPTDSEEGKTYVITSIEHSASESLPYAAGASELEFSCTNRFTCIPSAIVFRPARITPKPRVTGVQTAIVVGPGGEEIFTDKYGRVKVQFHWDREGKKDENSSCWIRVAQNWAGKNWGIVFNPRIGQEVIVDFLEGDPDRPIIVGRIYNAEQMPPYALPGEQTKSTIKSRSSKGGGTDNFNEIRFEDKKGSEQVLIHAEKNQDIEVENDETHWVGHDRKKTIDHDETTHVKHDRTETVDNNEKITIHGNRTETVDKNETITIHSNRTETVDKEEKITIGGGRTEQVAKDEKITIGASRTENVAKEETITIAGGRTESVAKNESITIGGGRTESVAKNESISVGDSRTTTVAKNDSLSVGKVLAISAGDEITLTTGKASITMKKDGTIVIKGKDITIEGSGKINGKAGGNMTLKGQKILQN
jgi:type VI secretion system secreted protein VgrG